MFVPDDVPLEPLARRPDVLAARWCTQASQHEIDAAKAAFYPNINLVAFVGFQALDTNNLLQAGSRSLGVGPAINLHIFHGGELNANLAGRLIDADLAILDYNQTQQQRQARQAIDSAYELAVERFRAGMGNYLTVLLAQTGVLTQARLNTNLRIRAYQLDANLAYALGGGYLADNPSTDTSSPSSH